jgi:hypothetical protein
LNPAKGKILQITFFFAARGENNAMSLQYFPPASRSTVQSNGQTNETEQELKEKELGSKRK